LKINPIVVGLRLIDGGLKINPIVVRLSRIDVGLKINLIQISVCGTHNMPWVKWAI
jgi:hypothetical protein